MLIACISTHGALLGTYQEVLTCIHVPTATLAHPVGACVINDLSAKNGVNMQPKNRDF
jgi:hypothetical protein